MAAKTLGAKLDDDLRAQVLNRCQTKGCRPSDYLKDLIKRDFATPESQPLPAAAAPENEGVQQQNERPQPVKTKSYIPAYIAKFRCKGCHGKLHDNENYEGPPAGKCDTCQEKFMQKTGGQCPFCARGQVEPLDAGDLQDMGML